MKNIEKNIKLTMNTFSLIFKYSPSYLLLLLFRVITSMSLSLVYVYIPKLIIEALTIHSDYFYTLKTILFFGVTVVVFQLCDHFINKKQQDSTEKISLELTKEVGQIVMDLSMYEIESTEEKDNIRLAGNINSITEVCTIIVNFFTDFFKIIGYICIISNINVNFFVVVFLLFLIKLIFTYINKRTSVYYRRLNAENDRLGDYLNKVCYFNKGAAKELRVNFIQKWFLYKVNIYREKMVRYQYEEFGKYFLFEAINAVLYSLSVLYILYSLAGSYINKALTIADFSLCLSTIMATSSALVKITEYMFEYNKKMMDVADFSKLIALNDNGKEKTDNSNLDINNVSIRFNNVWFKYPNGENYVLKNINIIIQSSQRIAIVGHNGAGKSTFIKLLCKFYKPSKGTITMNGIDIWNIPDEEYIKYISAVFQDFKIPSFTVSDNIALGKNKDIDEVLKNVSAYDFVNALPNGINTYVNKNISSEGVELSGGQEQKIALARALYKDAPILILDEPTSNIDPKIEGELYESLFNSTQGKMLVFISHRLAVTRFCDKIAVFDDGYICEYGTHKDLINQTGLYSKMYNAQSEYYI